VSARAARVNQRTSNPNTSTLKPTHHSRTRSLTHSLTLPDTFSTRPYFLPNPNGHLFRTSSTLSTKPRPRRTNTFFSFKSRFILFSSEEFCRQQLLTIYSLTHSLSHGTDGVVYLQDRGARAAHSLYKVGASAREGNAHSLGESIVRHVRVEIPRGE
jgi:hypothetical protein